MHGTEENSGNWSRRGKGNYLGRYYHFCREHFTEWTVSFELPWPRITGFSIQMVSVFFSMRCAQILKQNCSHDMYRDCYMILSLGIAAACSNQGCLIIKQARACMVMVIQQISWSQRICHSACGVFLWQACSITGSQSSKFEHQGASPLLRNIRNISICMGKNLSFL